MTELNARILIIVISIGLLAGMLGFLIGRGLQLGRSIRQARIPLVLKLDGTAASLASKSFALFLVPGMVFATSLVFFIPVAVGGLPPWHLPFVLMGMWPLANLAQAFQGAALSLWARQTGESRLYRADEVSA